MASGSKLSGSFSLGSDQEFDKNCSVCESKQKIKEAIACCTACSEYFCKECLDFHNSLSVLRDHRAKLLGKTTMLKSPAKSGARGAITTMCDNHSGKLMEMFCQSHKVVCCTVCVAEKHRRCDNVEYVPNIAAGFSKSPDVSRLKSDLRKIKQDLTRIRSSRQTDQTRIMQESDKVLAQIKDYRQMINAIFDNLEKSVIEGAQQRQQKYDVKIQTDLDGCNDALRSIEETFKDLDDMDKQNEAQMFVNVKRADDNMKEWRELQQEVEAYIGEEKIKFHADSNIEKYLASLEILGLFVDEMQVSGQLHTVYGTEGQLHTVDGTEEAVVRMEDESDVCDIRGSCFLPDDSTLITDNTNNKLKRLDATYRIIDSCHIQDPQGVCYIPQTQEAVVCQWKGPIHVVSVRTKLRIVRSIKLYKHNDCFGVAYSNGLLYVGQCNGNKLHVYDYASGQHKSVIQKDRQEQDIFSNDIRLIAASPDGTMIWVADHNKGLIQLDVDCNLRRVVKDDEQLDGAVGVCVDRHNCVFMCGYCSRNVLQLSPEGEKVGTLVRPDDLPAYPQSVCYDEVRSRLLVTTDECDRIKVFRLK